MTNGSSRPVGEAGQFMATKQKHFLTFRLRSTNCEACDFTCNLRKLLRCPACRQLFGSEQVDLWEVYDGCMICPACDRVVAGYETFVLCPHDSGSDLS